MLRSEKSQHLLARPISVYHCEKSSDSKITVSFLILLKGDGTKELCSLEKGDGVQVLGPLGNTFSQYAGGESCAGESSAAAKSCAGESSAASLSSDSSAPNSCAPVCVIGGGIGVAPVAGFSETLPDASYDFFACFKSGSYGLENVHARNLVITTDDGSVGIKGMLPNALDAQKLKEAGYKAVYACGPTPMLAYVQKICVESGIKCFLSMENRMACGVGACLGCTIETTEGNRRCCKDGPVFEGEKLIFAKPQAAGKTDSAKTAAGANNAATGAKTESAKTAGPDLSVNIAGVDFQNPVIAASGTFGFGQEYETVFDVNRLGGICSKGLTLDPRPGNTGMRLWETPSGLVNSIGLENPGIRHFIDKKLPEMKKLKCVSIANLSGHSIEKYVEGARLLDASDVDMIELNISCPNVKAGGMGFGLEPCMASEVTSKVREATKKPLIVKLSPNAPSVKDVAKAVIDSGADAISICNTFQAMAIDIDKEKFVFDNKTAGLAGPAVKPLALRIVYDVCSMIKTLPEEKQVPVIGLGGISCWQDAVEFILAGAGAIQVGTATFSNPNCMIEIIDGLKKWMAKKGYSKISDFCGKML
ncbi:MAG: dihydroorotate dehydrogenase [Treponemataceae bacterium]|nr:dihydroorotate dehydrogenase [Treponemataceae bacterium]